MNQQNIDIDDGPSKGGLSQVLKNFAVGGLSGMVATAFIQPADMLKTRIQLASEARVNCSPGFVFSKIIHQQGITGLYAGLDSALLRQFIYCGARLGIYYNLADHFQIRNGNGDANITLMQKGYCSFIAGAIASTFCTPCSLVLTRMQADRTLPPPFRRNYKHVFHAFQDIAQKEGILNLWTGGQITLLRACAMNVGMMVTYEEGKERLSKLLLKEGESNPRYIEILAAVISAFVIGVGSLPFDNIKTKLQKQYRDAAGKRSYHGIADCFAKTIKQEGVRSLWVGLPTYYLRVGPHALITL